MGARGIAGGAVMALALTLTGCGTAVAPRADAEGCGSVAPIGRSYVTPPEAPPPGPPTAPRVATEVGDGVALDPGGEVSGPPVQLDLALPAVTVEQQAVLDRVDRRYEGVEAYGGLALSDDRSRVEVLWHGEVDPDLAATAADRDLPIEVVVVPTRYTQRALERESRRLMGEAADSGVELCWAGPARDLGGLDVGLARPGDVDAATLAGLSRYPISPG